MQIAGFQVNLHSNMVRFIICNDKIGCRKTYGIYIPIWLDLLSLLSIASLIILFYLHSNMVRFIITLLYL